MTVSSTQMPAPLDRYDIPDLLANLVERSMVVLDTETGAYHLTESMRAYASENLTEADAAMPRRHFHYYTTLAERLFEQTLNGEEAAAHLSFARQEGNFRAAYEWSFEHDPEGCLHLMACLVTPWHMRAPSEAIDHARNILEAAPGAKPEDQIWLRVRLALVVMRRSDLTFGVQLLDGALQHLETVDIPMARVSALSTRGMWYREQGNQAAALEIMQEALAIAEANDLPRQQASAHTNLGELARQQGHYEEAKRHYLEAIEKCGSKFHTGLNFYNLGQLSVDHNDPYTAEQYYREGLDWLADAGPNPMVCALHGGLGMAYLLQGDPRRAGLLMGWARGWSTQQNFVMDPLDRQLFERMLAVGEESERFRTAFQAGLRMTFQEVRASAELSPPSSGG